MADTVVEEYEVPTVTPAELQGAISEIVATEASSIRELVEDLVPGQAPSAETPIQDLITVSVEEDGSGLDPMVVTAIVTISTTVTAHAATSVWDAIVLPRLKRRFGVNVLEPKSRKS